METELGHDVIGAVSPDPVTVPEEGEAESESEFKSLKHSGSLEYKHMFILCWNFVDCACTPPYR